MDLFPFLAFPLVTFFDKCLNSHFDDCVHSAGHYDDSREVEVEGETMVYEEVTLYYPRPNRCELSVDVIIIITRSYAALWAADLDWIVRPGYRLGRYFLEKNHEKPTWNHEKP